MNFNIEKAAADLGRWLNQNKDWIISTGAAAAVLGALGAYLGRSKYQDMRLQYQSEATQRYIENNAERFLVTYIDGPQGSGKSTFAAGLTNSLSLRNQNIFKARMKHATIVFHEIDFNAVNELIDDQITAGKNEYFATTEVAKRFPAFTDKIDTKLKLTEGTSVLRQYVDAYYALNRDNYVMFPNREFISYLNGKPALNFRPEFINLKDIREAKKSFLIPRGTVIFEDEKQNATGKDCYSTFDYVKRDPGSLKFFQYIRHIGDATIFYLTTDQVFGNALAAERKLATSVVRMLGHKIETIRHPADNIFKFAQHFYNWIYAKRTKRQGIDVLFDNEKLRKRLYKLYQHRNEIFSQSFIKFDCLIYHNFDDVGKRIEATTFGGEHRSFVFPIKSPYGSINSWMFSFLFDELRGGGAVEAPEILLTESPAERANSILKKIDEERRAQEMLEEVKKEERKAKEAEEKERKKAEEADRKQKARLELIEKQKAAKLEIFNSKKEKK